MVHGVSNCFFCDEKAEDGHCQKPLHILRVHKAFVDREKFDHIVRECRPSEAERRLKAMCLDKIQAALRPVGLYPTGSAGKETALRGEHDIDVAIVVPDGPTDTFLDKAKDALQRQGFYNVAVQKRADFGRRLITAEYEDLSLDILPVRNLDDSGWAAEAVKSAKFFRQMLPAWQKDVVRILKALLRLELPHMPGILLETCIFEADVPPTQAIRNGTWAVLERLGQLQPCRCPCSGRDLMQDPRVWNTRDKLQEYCLELLALRQTPVVDLGPYCLQSLPCGHYVTVTAGRSYSDSVTLNHEVAKLMLRLGVQFHGPASKEHVIKASRQDDAYIIAHFVSRTVQLRQLRSQLDNLPYNREVEAEEAYYERHQEEEENVPQTPSRPSPIFLAVLAHLVGFICILVLYPVLCSLSSNNRSI